MIASFELGAGQLLVSEAELVSKVGLVSAGVGAGGVIYQWNVRQTPHSRLTLCPADRFSYSTHRAYTALSRMYIVMNFCVHCTGCISECKVCI